MALGRDSKPEHRGLKTLQVVGFALLAWAILAAHTTPADGYEVSIYAATTAAFWIGVGLALVVALLTVSYAQRPPVTSLGLLLGGGAVVAIVSLPIIRGYHFYGLADSLTHLGWTRSIALGQLSAFELLYPGSHLQSVLIAAVGGIPATRAMMLVVVASLLAFLVFLPLTVRTLVPYPLAVSIAAFSGFLLLPLNMVGTHRMFHPFTLATLLFPLVLYLMFKHANGDTDRTGLTSAAGWVLPTATAAILFIHPQTALNVIIFFGTIAAVQLGYRRYRPNHRISQTRPIYGQTAFLVVLFFAWSLQFWQTYSLLTGLGKAVVSTVLGAGQIGAVVSQETQNAPRVGASVAELFVKLFLVSAVYVVIAAGLVGAKLLGSIRDRHPDRHVAIAYFTFSAFTLGPFFLAHYLGSISHYFFRHLGFAMVVVTVLGAIAIHSVQRPLGGTARSLLRPIGVVAIGMLLVLSLIAVYPSPYVFRHNHHAPDRLMEGYESTFAYQPNVPADSPEAVWFVGIQGGPGRYVEALNAGEIEYRGEVNNSSMHGGIVSNVANRSGPDVDRDFYLPITAPGRAREVQAYRGFRYSRADFEAIDNQPGVHRVHANGGFTLYYIDTSTAEESS